MIINDEHIIISKQHSNDSSSNLNDLPNKSNTKNQGNINKVISKKKTFNLMDYND